MLLFINIVFVFIVVEFKEFVIRILFDLNI